LFNFPTQKDQNLKIGGAAKRPPVRRSQFKHTVHEDPTLTAQKTPTWTAQKSVHNAHIDPINVQNSARRHADRRHSGSFQFMLAAAAGELRSNGLQQLWTRIFSFLYEVTGSSSYGFLYEVTGSSSYGLC